MKEVIQAVMISLKYLHRHDYTPPHDPPPVWGPAHCQGVGHGLVPVHGQGHQHVVGGGQGVGLEKLKHLAEDKTS